MNNFKEWLHIQEFSDINAMDTGHIDLQYQNGDYIYRFEINGSPYELTMHSKKKDILDTYLNGYDISFTGNYRYGPTNDKGAKAADVYTHIMLGIKKFLEEVQSNVMRPAEFLSFYGFENKQDLVYDRLVRRFLTGYTRVNNEDLVRNDVLEHLKSQYGPNVEKRVQQGQERYKNFLAQTREEERQKKLGA